MCLWAQEAPARAHHRRVWKAPHNTPTPSPGVPELSSVLRELQLFWGLLYPRPFWEVGDSCSYKARDSWVAEDSWMGLASSCLPGCPGTPRPDSRQLAALPTA